MPESVLFWIMGPLAVLAALGMLLVKKAVHSALLLAWVMITLAFFYIAQGALFLGIVQVVVYTGAVMMLFLFILMLVGVDSSDSLTETIRGLRPIAITAAVGFGGLMVSLVGRASLGREPVGLDAANAGGNVQGLAHLLFSTYVWPFEVVSALLITAAIGFGGLMVSLIGRASIGREPIGLEAANAAGNVQGLSYLLFSTYVWPFEVVSALLITAALGAMVLAHHQREIARPTQRDLSEQRFRSGSLATAAGLPGPGVFARHNAVDVPALVPDGTPSPASISETLRTRGDMIDSSQYQLDQIKTEVTEEK